MPFVKEKDVRKKMERLAQNIAHDWPILELNGDLNCLLYILCKRYVEPSYNNYKAFLGELERAIHQVEVDLLDPYEEEARMRNGDFE